MDISKLIYEIRMAENGKQNFRNWLFGENSKLDLKNRDIVQEQFGELRKIITNNINVIDIYEVTNEKYTYNIVVVCDGFSAHNYLTDKIFCL